MVRSHLVRVLGGSRRLLSTSPGLTTAYEAPLGHVLRRVKFMSLASCSMTTIGSPGLVLAGEGSVPAIAMGGLVMAFGFFTTGVLHWFSKTYILKLLTDPQKPDEVIVEKLDFWARTTRLPVQYTEIQQPNTTRPLVTFRANGVPYYFDTDLVDDVDLLDKIVPWEELFEDEDDLTSADESADESVSDRNGKPSS